MKAMDLKIFQKLEAKKGVAGLNVLLSIVSMLFVIGIIVMVFVLAGSKMRDAVDDVDAEAVINATMTSIDDVTDWFPTIIVLGAMVVLILLVVIIINSIKGSGITDAGA